MTSAHHRPERIREAPMISTRDLSVLPPIDDLKKLTQALAMLDAVVQRDWEGRYYSFNAHWSNEEQLASMRNGEGDEWLCVFSKYGAFLKGLHHESEMAKGWSGLLDGVPDVFKSALDEPAFSMEYTSFCIWRTYEDDQWRTGSISYPPGDDPDGSAWMLAILDGNPSRYQRWAEECYGRPIELSAVEQVYAHNTLTDQIVRSLNSQISLWDVVVDASEIGYPLSRHAS